MRRWLLATAILAACGFQMGCGDGVAMTRAERQQSYKRGLERDMQMLNDDIDLFLLNDRPSRLSRFRVY